MHRAAAVDEADLVRLAGSDLDDDGVLTEARTWLARRPQHSLNNAG